MKLTLSYDEGEKELDVEQTESSIWKSIGKELLNINIPNSIYISCELGDACLDIKKRGTYIKNGEIKPSMYVVPTYNHINIQSSSYEDAYLTCINPESNNYKFYHLKPNAYGIGATYGRIGSERGEMFGVKDLQTPYDSYLYWIRYYEKLSKGYVDQSDIFLNKKKPNKKVSTKNEIKVPQFSQKLFSLLRSCAKRYVEQYCVNDTFTYTQVKKSKKLLKELGQRKTLNGFNKKLMELMSVSPRKARYIDEYLAKSVGDFPHIIDRETDLVSAMEALVIEDTPILNDSFEAHNIELYIATDKQKKEVMHLLSPQLQPKVKTVYRVINKSHKKRFNDYLEKNNIKKVKQLWHGSKNENWLSIILNGLQLNPNAAITGKMFEQGIYFAPSSLKSWNYTSYRGTYWANGSQDFAFMGLYATAYGCPEDIYCSHQYTKGELQRLGKNCVHAHAGQQLRNAEIISYDEAAMLLNYIVEFN